MIKYVIKRTGRKVKFNKKKIYQAVLEAFKVCDDNITADKEFANKIADEIESMNLPECMSVEDIQDLIEKKLMQSSRKDVAKVYINYRYLKDMARSQYKELIDAVGEKLKANNVQNQNANVDEHSFGGRVGEASSVITKNYALNYLVSDMAKNNHENNEIYIHDLDSYAVGSHNCLSIPFDELLANGFNTRQGDVRSAGSVSTAFQLVAVLFQLQSLQQFGGVSATHLDWTMVPYVRKSFYKHYMDCLNIIPLCKTIKLDIQKNDIIKTSIDDEIYTGGSFNLVKRYVHRKAKDLLIKEIAQAVEGMYHNLNTLQSRSGNQLPFTSINYGTCTLTEGRMIIKALLEGSLKGIGKLSKTSIFPCGIFQCMEGINRKKGDLNYDLFRLALKSTSQRVYPNYANVNWTGNEGYDINNPQTYFSTMGCRTANGYDINGLGQQKDGRGNICPVTIILPTLAMEAKEFIFNEQGKEGLVDEDAIISKFIEILNTKIEEARDMLIERFEWICSQPPEAAKFMYENNVMAGYIPEEGIRSALRHGTLAIGQLGLAETLQILIGCDQTSSDGMKLAKKIEKVFKDKCAKFKKEYKLNFGVYYTPAENLCYTAMKKFKDKYGIIENVSDREYFTNSIHVPVWKEVTPYEKIDIESELTGYSSAGCITYVELDSTCKHNINALEKIVNYAMDKDIPYFAVNVPNDTCLECGYTDEIGPVCPVCGSDKIQRLRRVTGYLSQDYRNFNKGKIKEVEQRIKHEGIVENVE